jgi:hypothetical protein
VPLEELDNTWRRCLGFVYKYWAYVSYVVGADFSGISFLDQTEENCDSSLPPIPLLIGPNTWVIENQKRKALILSVLVLKN